ncbi:MAG: peptidase M48 [Desulfuromonas sp.]|nr:MAG: peptidase M48 [Desulfuromonas sp.]
MKFTPRQLEGNVNVSKGHPLAELGWMIGGLLLVVLLVYLLLGFGADYLAERMPVSFETRLGIAADEAFPGDDDTDLQERLDALLALVPKNSPLHQYSFRVLRSPIPEVNAIALPGGTIVVFAGLLDKVESENELAMVLAHELGHFAHRDHLKKLGRGLGLTALSLVLFGQDSAVTDMVSRAFITFDSGYSRKQESAADSFGLKLLVARYGHAGGSTDFFARMSQEAGSKTAYLLASHPHPESRIDALQRMIEQAGYGEKAVEPLLIKLHPEGINGIQ